MLSSDNKRGLKSIKNHYFSQRQGKDNSIEIHYNGIYNT